MDNTNVISSVQKTCVSCMLFPVWRDLLLLPALHYEQFYHSYQGRLARWHKWRACDLWCRRSKRRVGEWAVAYMKQWKGWRMSCDIGKATEGLENELWCRWSHGKVGQWAELHCFTYLRHSSFSNPSFASPTSQALHLRHLASHPCNTYLCTGNACFVI